MTPETLLEKYFTHGLTPEEQQVLDAYLETHPEQAERFAEEKDLQKALIADGKEELRARLSHLGKTASSKEEEHSRRSFIKYAIAAAVIIGCTLFAVKSFGPSTENTDRLYADYFQPYRNVIAPIERGTPAVTTEEKAFESYELGQYQKAAKQFEELSDGAAVSYYKFYRAMCLMSLEQHIQAVAILEDYPRSDQDFYDKSRWFLALAYLKTANKTKATALLQSIVKEKTYNHTQASALLEKL